MKMFMGMRNLFEIKGFGILKVWLLFKFLFIFFFDYFNFVLKECYFLIV